MAAARYKGLPYKKVNLLPVQHKIQMKLMTGADSVPAMKAGSQKIATSRAIMRTLDALRPEPPLYPTDPDEHARVEEAVVWSDGDFQDVGRRLIWSQMVRAPDQLFNYSAGEKLPIPEALGRPLGKPTAMIARWYNKGSDENVQSDLVKLPGLLDKVDDYIEQGVIGGKQPYAADFLIGASLALWMTMDDIRPFVVDRPGGKLAARLFPDYKGSVKSGVLPSAWFDTLREAPAATSAQPA